MVSTSGIQLAVHILSFIQNAILTLQPTAVALFWQTETEIVAQFIAQRLSANVSFLHSWILYDKLHGIDNHRRMLINRIDVLCVLVVRDNGLRSWLDSVELTEIDREQRTIIIYDGQLNDSVILSTMVLCYSRLNGVLLFNDNDSLLYGWNHLACVTDHSLEPISMRHIFDPIGMSGQYFMNRVRCSPDAGFMLHGDIREPKVYLQDRRLDGFEIRLSKLLAEQFHSTIFEEQIDESPDDVDVIFDSDRLESSGSVDT